MKAARWVALTVVLLSSAACNYGFRGGSFPDHIRTFAVLEFDNETTRFELTQEIYLAMRQELPRALGVRVGGEEVADAFVRGVITGYEVTTPNYRQGEQGDRAEVLQRQVNLTVRVELVDRIQNVVLWESSSLRVEGQYLEASESEEVGKQEAIELLVQKIVDGAQSNW